MKIKVSYEDRNHPTVLDVPDDECEIWVEQDYQRRLEEAEDKDSVTRRTAQEIMDEEFNKPAFNNQQTETRRHVSLDTLDDENLGCTTDPLDDVLENDKYRELHDAIEMLRPQQKELLRRIYRDGESQRKIAS